LEQRSTVVLTGALAGGLLAVSLVALFVGRFAMDSASLSTGGDGQLEVAGGALYLATVVASAIGGAVVSAIAYGASSGDDDDSAHFEFVYVLPFGLAAAIVTGYSILRAGLGMTADIGAGTITVTIAALTLTALASGLITGAVTSWVVSTLAAKRIVGLEGEAAPTSTAAVMRAAVQAVTGPMLAILVIAALSISLAQLLLAAEGVAAIVIFGGAAALVLFGAAAAAYLGGDTTTAE
jgi:hypothetical protein